MKRIDKFNGLEDFTIFEIAQYYDLQIVLSYIGKEGYSYNKRTYNRVLLKGKGEKFYLLNRYDRIFSDEETQDIGLSKFDKEGAFLLSKKEVEEWKSFRLQEEMLNEMEEF